MLGLIIVLVSIVASSILSIVGSVSIKLFKIDILIAAVVK